MKNLFLITIALLVFTACESEATHPSWIDDVIAKHKSEGAQTPAKIFECTYKDEKVYSINLCVACPDYLTKVYNAEKKVVCEIGGFAGNITCPDFDCTGKETIIYEHTIAKE